MFQANFSIDALLSKKVHSVLGLTAKSLSWNLNLLNVDEHSPRIFPSGMFIRISMFGWWKLVVFNLSFNPNIQDVLTDPCIILLFYIGQLALTAPTPIKEKLCQQFRAMPICTSLQSGLALHYVWLA